MGGKGVYIKRVVEDVNTKKEWRGMEKEWRRGCHTVEKWIE